MHQAFSSLPAEEEQQFLVYEERTQSTAKQAMVLGLGVSLGLGALALLIILAYWGPIHAVGAEEAAPAKPAAAAPAK